MAVDPDHLASQPIGRLVSLQGRVAAVSGGARGIGYAICNRLAEAGADIVVGDRDGDGATRAAELLAGAHGIKAVGAFVDVASAASVVTFAAAADAWGKLDIWVNCAGIQPGKLLVDTSDEEWQQMSDVNLSGVFYGCREAARRMVPAGSGVIINITSVCGYRGRASLAHYCASKHGVVGLTQSLAMEVGPAGVRVLAVSPGQTDTPGWREQMELTAQRAETSGDSYQAMMETGRKIIPLRRIGRPDDIARAVLFCASDLAAFMTATTVFADGGLSAY